VAQLGDVVRQRRLGELASDDLMPSRMQTADHRRPRRIIRPRACTKTIRMSVPLRQRSPWPCRLCHGRRSWYQRITGANLRGAPSAEPTPSPLIRRLRAIFKFSRLRNDLHHSHRRLPRACRARQSQEFHSYRATRGLTCSPDRIRTGATALRGRRARPLHNGATMAQSSTARIDRAGVPGLEPRLTEPESVGLPITPYPIDTHPRWAASR
jgi:hypothetical protein